ncbi:MAG: hypothetical protein K0R67_1022, partial [Paenibacillus sp.]|nr:hypothetical protein [Paenibacillus sp.]
GVLATSWHFARSIEIAASGQLQLERMPDLTVTLEQVPDLLEEIHHNPEIGKAMVSISS